MATTGIDPKDIKLLEASSKAYLEKHNITTYLEDALSRLLEDRPDKPANVRRGTNTLLREYEYVRATPRNRLDFCDRFADVLSGRTAASYTATEYHHLVELICPDFPRDVILQAAELAVRLDGGVSTSLGTPQSVSSSNQKMPTVAFVGSLRICFFYTEFVAFSRSVILSEIAKASPSPFLDADAADELVVLMSIPERQALGDSLREALAKVSTDSAKGRTTSMLVPPSLAVEYGLTKTQEYLNATREVVVAEMIRTLNLSILHECEIPRHVRQ
ncbi:hypothetical protein HKX48_001567 [Thoreauomyces humboldtii]|nr:hypothetical protein HKX48_001567 [Thoreauomyces humboldtii]